MAESIPVSDPHAGESALSSGVPLGSASAALILLHGRGGSAQDILSLSNHLDLKGFACLAPQARDNTWYPQSFLAPLEANQPYLDSALRRVETLVTGLIAKDVPIERIALLGFSQGACLALEFAARHPRLYGAVIGFTGGLIGPPGTPRHYPGSLADVPVFLGAGDPDPHVPFSRVEETAQVLTRMGATVDLRRYPGMPHTINQDELAAARELLRSIAGQEG